MRSIQNFTPLNAVVATTTSEAINIQYAEKVTLEFTRANHSVGSSAFTVTVSIDGETYVAYNKIISNVTNTNGQDLTRVATVTLAADGSSVASLDLSQDTFRFMKVTVTETTDGTHTCKAAVVYNN